MTDTRTRVPLTKAVDLAGATVIGYLNIIVHNTAVRVPYYAA